ncbi:hypothetical protein DPEC_G00063270 [Dallia pectoralis]|uniref:Uncharacterized protein n=1 Tax=Dallia pectoralis TaxID=75939 RepID=A0ACC2H8E1_DALPE|nr:hypothetical protein DPEC_G00063270 [Dallia pectoralis]
MYIVERQLAENPVHVVCPETGDKQKSRTLHCNLLLLVNDLPVDATPSDSRPILEKKTQNRRNQERITDTQRQADASDYSEDDSDDDSGSGYWLRRLTERTEKRPVIYQEQLTRYPEIRGSEPEPVGRGSHLVPEHLPNPAERRHNADENLLNGFVEGEEDNGHQDSDSEARPLTPPVEHTQSDVRRELKIQGGQIGDQGSDLSYNSVCRQIEDGLKEQFSDAEVVRAVLKVIKPGTFKDMLMNKDDLSVEELKAFLHSHLGEQSNTELFQELMCTKQRDNETPQQFLYRVIGLKQKIMLASKHADTDVKYNASTVQDVFLHTVYQGLGHKHDDVRRELKPLLVDTRVSDEAILKQMKKIMCDESERQRRLGPNTRQRLTNVHSAQSEVNAAQCPSGKEKVPKTDTIQQLTEKLDQLTSMVELMRHSMQTQVTGQFSHNWKGRGDRRREKPYGCDKCVEQNRPDCPHCFHCGEEGHRAVGCLKKPTGQGNWSRSLPRDRQ